MMRQTIAYTAFVTLLLTTAFAGCRREPLPSTGDPISFSVGTVGSALVTKADEKPTAQEYLIKDGNQIAVWAERIISDTRSNVFDDSPVTVLCNQDGENFTWDYTGGNASKIKYWAQTGMYKFRSVFPTTANVQSNTNSEELVVYYSMHDDNYDLMVASAEVSTASRASSQVPLIFHHACAALRFYFTCDSDDPYYIKNFALDNVRTIGLLTYWGTGETKVAVGEWALLYPQAPQVYQWIAEDDDHRWAVDKTTGYNTQWYFAIPQDLLESSNANPAVEFTYVNGYDQEIPAKLPLPLHYLDSGNVEHEVVWEPGKIYIYNIQLQPEKTTLTLTVEDWDQFYVSGGDIIF